MPHDYKIYYFYGKSYYFDYKIISTKLPTGYLTGKLFLFFYSYIRIIFSFQTCSIHMNSKGSNS